MKPVLRLAILLSAALVPALSAAPLSASPKQVLVFTKSSGFIHDGVKTDGQPGHGFVFRVLRQLGAAHDITLVESKDGALFSPEYLVQFDGFIFYTSGDLTMAKSDPRGDGLPPMSPPGKAALLEAVANGKGFVGLHIASDNFHSRGNSAPGPARFDDDGDQADPYVKMLGGEFIRHAAQQTARLEVVDPHFPGAAALPASWLLHEEWFSLKNFAHDMHAIVVLNPAGMKGAEYQRAPFPCAWVRRHGQGRVFYTSLGHREDVWDNPAFQSLLLGGLQWTLGRVEADVSPNLATAAPRAHVLPKYAP